MFLVNFSLVYADAKQDAEDREIGYEDGLKWGDATGSIYGYRDKVNKERSNWERSYKEVKTKVVSEYNLSSQSYPYRSRFQEAFEVGFESGYEKGYRNTTFDSAMSATSIGLEHGEFFGRMLGEKQGRQDYSKGLKSDWQRNLPAESAIIQEYHLKNDSKVYLDAFIDGYKLGYEEEYLFSYRTVNYDVQRVTKEMGIEHGIEAGEQVGSAMGISYYVQGNGNSWQSALSEYESQQQLSSRFLLLRETPQYRLGFLEGFKDGFRSSFSESYQDLNMRVANENVNWKRVNMFEETIAYSETVVNFVSGSQSNNTVKLVELLFESGTVYRDTYIGLLKEEGSFNQLYGSYEPASKVFEVRIFNDLNQTQFRKPVNLNFEYYGSDRAGIYRLINNEWIYQYSTLEEGKIITKIPAMMYTGGKYAVLIDDNYVELSDIVTHWAGKELYAYLRRGYIQGYSDRTFKPNNNISKGDFLNLLSTVRKSSSDELTDQADLNGVVSHEEVELIMQKVLRDSNFSWSEIADKMMYEKYTRSKENYVTRGEAVYMLHELQQAGRLN